jgi:tape measure domain-containing protein
MVRIGSVELNLRLDRSEFDRAISELQRASLPTITPKIDIYNLRKADLYVDRLNKKFKDLQKTFDSKPLTPKVNLDELHDLNSLLDKKLSHYKQVQNYFNQNPLEVKAKDNNIKATVNIQGKYDTKINNNIDKTASGINGLSKLVSESNKLLQNIGNNTKDGLLKSVARGATESIGRDVLSPTTQTIRKGASNSIAPIINSFIGDLELFSQKAFEKLGSSLASYLGETIDVNQLLRAIPEAKITEDILKLIFPDISGSKLKRIKESLLEKVESIIDVINDFPDIVQEQINNIVGIEQLTLAKAKNTAPKNQISDDNLNSLIPALNELKKTLATQKGELGKERAFQETVTDKTLYKASEEKQNLIKKEISRTELLIRQFNAVITKYNQQYPIVIQNILKDLTGLDIGLDKLPNIKTLSKTAQQQTGANAGYIAQSNTLMLAPELIEKLRKNIELTTDEYTRLVHELDHAVKLDFGSFKGVQKATTGNIPLSEVPQIPKEFQSQILQNLSLYNPKDLKLEQSAFVKQFEAQKQFKQGNSTKNLIDLSGIINTGNSKITEAVKLLNGLKQIGEVALPTEAFSSINSDINSLISSFSDIQNSLEISQKEINSNSFSDTSEIEKTVNAQITDLIKMLNHFDSEKDKIKQSIITAKTPLPELRTPELVAIENLPIAQKQAMAIPTENSGVPLSNLKQPDVKLGSQINKAFDTLKQNISGKKVEDIKASVKGIGKSFSTAYQEFQKAVKDKNLNLAKAYGQTLKETSSKAFNDIDRFIADLKSSGQLDDEVLTALQSLKGVKGGIAKKTKKGGLIDSNLRKLETRFTIPDPWAESENVGKNITKGVASGINKNKIEATQASIKLANDIIETTKDELGIASPSKEFETIAKQILAGLKKGLDSKEQFNIGKTIIESYQKGFNINQITKAVNLSPLVNEIKSQTKKAVEMGFDPNDAVDYLDQIEKEISDLILNTINQLNQGIQGEDILGNLISDADFKDFESPDLESIRKFTKEVTNGLKQNTLTEQSRELNEFVRTIEVLRKQIKKGIADPNSLLDDDAISKEGLKAIENAKISIKNYEEAVKDVEENINNTETGGQLDFGKLIAEDFGKAGNFVKGKLDEFFLTPFGKMAKGVGLAVIGFNLFDRVKDSLIQFSKVAFETAKQTESLKIALDFSTAEGGLKTIQRLQKEANELGISFMQSAKGYQQLSAATLGTKLENQTQQIFKGFQEGSAVRSLSTVQQESVFRAISQIASKGRVSLEELNQQLGEAMPGALQTAARAMGVTSGELIRMVENGQILAEDLLPKLSAQLSLEAQSGLAGASKTTQAQLNRLDNTLEELQNSLGSTTLLLAKLGLPAVNSLLKFTVDNIGIVTIGVTSLSLVLLAKFIPAIYAIINGLKFGQIALKVFGIEALATMAKTQGLGAVALTVGKGFGALALQALPLVAIGVTIAGITKAFTPLNDQIKQAVENLKNLNKEKVSEDIITEIDTSQGISENSRKQLQEEQQKEKKQFSWWALVPGSGLKDAIQSPFKLVENIQKGFYIKDFNSALQSVDELLAKTQSLKDIEIGQQIISDIDNQIKDKQIEIEVAINKGNSQKDIAELQQQLADLQGLRVSSINDFIPDYGSTVSTLKEAETVLEGLHNDYKDGKITAKMYEQGIDSIIPKIDSLRLKVSQYDAVIKTNIENIKKMAYALYEVQKEALNLDNALNNKQLTSQTELLKQRARGEIGDIGLQQSQSNLEVEINSSKLGNNDAIFKELQSIFVKEISANTRRRVSELLNVRGDILNEIQALSPEIIDLAMNANTQLLESHPELRQALVTLQEITRKRQEGLTLENQLAQSELNRRKEEEAQLNRELTARRQLISMRLNGALERNNLNDLTERNNITQQRLSGAISPEVAQLKSTFQQLNKSLIDNTDKLKSIQSIAKTLDSSVNREKLATLSQLSGRRITSTTQISGGEAQGMLSMESDLLTPEIRDILENIQTVRQLMFDHQTNAIQYYEAVANEQQRLNGEIKTLTESSKGLADQSIELGKNAGQAYKDLLKSHADFMQNIQRSIQETQLQITGLITQIKGITARLNLKSALTPGLNSIFDGVIGGIINALGVVQQFAMAEIEKKQKKMSLGFEMSGMRQQAEQFKVSIDSANAQRANVIAQRAGLSTQRDEMARQYENLVNQYNELYKRTGATSQTQQMLTNLNNLANNIRNISNGINSIQVPQQMDYSLVAQQQQQINQLEKFKSQQLQYEAQLLDLQNRESLLDSANSIISSYNQLTQQISQTAKDVQKQVSQIRRMGAELSIDPESYAGKLAQITNQINDQYDSIEESAKERLEQIKKEMAGIGDLRRAEAEMSPIIAKLRSEGQNAQADALQRSLSEASSKFGELESSFNSLSGAVGELSGQRATALKKAIDDFNKEIARKVQEFEQNQIIEFYDVQASRIKDREQRAIYEAGGQKLRLELEFDRAKEEMEKLIKETNIGAEQAQLWRDRLQAINDVKLENIQDQLKETRKQIAEERWKAPIVSRAELFNAEADAEIDPFASANLRGQAQMLEQQMWFYDQIQNISKMREELGLTAETANEMYNNLYRINELKMDKIREESNLVAKVLKEAVHSAIEENLASFFKFEQDFNTTLSNIAKSILKTIADLAAKAAAAQLMKGFMGMFGGLFGGMFGGGPQMSPSVPQMYGPGFYNGGTVQNFAEGGIVQMGLSLMSAMAKERAMGGQPVPIVASVGEEILSTKRGDAQFYRMLRQSGKWDSMKVGNFSDGGTIGNVNFSGGGYANNANINITVVTPNADSFRKSENQIGREIGERQQRFYRRNT